MIRQIGSRTEQVAENERFGGHREGQMKYLRYLALLAVCMFAASYSHAQVAVGVGVGGGYYGGYAYGPPVCAYGYYDYAPYACAPYGYWGPDYFVNGVFIGVGPWYGYGFGRGFYGRGFYGRGYYGRGGYGRGFYGRGGYGGYGWGGFGGGNATTTVNEYQVGTMVVDIFSTKDKKLIFRGVGQDEISDKPEKNEKKIEKGTEKMFKKFPPGADEKK